VAQAEAAARLLRDRGIGTIVASPLSRAHDTALAVGRALGLPVRTDDGLRECAFGVQEGQPMADWFHDWVAEKSTPEGGEPFAALRARAIAAINRATAAPGLVLVVGHGAFFRAVRSAAGMTANVRTRNAEPMRMDPPVPGESAWRLTSLVPATA
jgi:probable phosphoglycerate mutase